MTTDPRVAEPTPPGAPRDRNERAANERLADVRRRGFAGARELARAPTLAPIRVTAAHRLRGAHA